MGETSERVALEKSIAGIILTSTLETTMSISADDIARFDALAGPDRMWSGVRGSSRPAADVRRGLREALADMQGRTCPQCGKALDNGEGIEFCHVVSRGPAIKGFVKGNIFAGHASCNSSTKPLYDNDGELISGIEVLTIDMLKRPDLIPTEWPPFPTLRAKRHA